MLGVRKWRTKSLDARFGCTRGGLSIEIREDAEGPVLDDAGLELTARYVSNKTSRTTAVKKVQSETANLGFDIVYVCVKKRYTGPYPPQNLLRISFVYVSGDITAISIIHHHHHISNSH